MENCMENARTLREGIEATGRFDIVSKEIGVPLLAFSLKDATKHTVFDIAESLRRFGWIIPAYTMPADAQNVAVLRVVIREDFSRGLAERLIDNLKQILKEIDAFPVRGTMQMPPTAVSAVVQDTDAEAKPPVKRTRRLTQEEITTHWRRLADRRRNGVC